MASLALDLAVDPRHHLSAQALTAPARLQQQHRGTDGKQHHGRDHADDAQRNDTDPSETDVSLLWLWSHRSAVPTRSNAGEPKHSPGKSGSA